MFPPAGSEPKRLLLNNNAASSIPTSVPLFKKDHMVRHKTPFLIPVFSTVIPAKAGIQFFGVFLDSRLRGSDGLIDKKTQKSCTIRLLRV
jgi:hypothetical protein